ncbi:MAG: DNA polymerase III subunit gamma/tau [Propylenella sp.]
MNETASGYQVLARKYRPARFDDLIGQEPMVRTLKNAFAAGRIPHAWMLTGVRGVGKTTTARILARGLNFEMEDGSGAPTVDLDGEGVHCRAVMEGRHPDVIEMDAASHTGIDDIRDIIDSARYAPVSARYKVYIIDEVHMLSRQAFNGLLKTLEEPPPHVKFVFATTEIRKVPVTVLSRCQRFDLRRIDAALLIAHLSAIAEKEEVEAEPEALRQIARAAEGSARDALSIFDQAIAHGGGKVEAAAVQEMLGLADRARIVDLFEHVMSGDTAAALAEIAAQHESGADPTVVLIDLADFTHYVTRLKLAPNAAGNAAISETERVRGAAFAEKLSLRVLSRAWQMLVKGIEETAEAPRPLASAEMVLVRLCHAASLPTPDEALRMLGEGGGASAPAPAPAPSPTPSTSTRSVRASAPSAAPRAARAMSAQRAEAPETVAIAEAAPELQSFDDVIARARAERDRLLVFALERHVRLVHFEPGRIEVALTAEAERDLPQRLGQALQNWTGRRWIVAISSGEAAAETAHEARVKNRASLMEEMRADPLVREVFTRFPGAEIVDVRERPSASDASGDEAAAGGAAEPATDEDS